MDILEIAQLEESRLAIGVAEISDHTLPIKSGGVACRGMPGWWNNMAVGLGMNGPVAREEIEELAKWYEAAGVEPRIEGCPLADASLFKHCEDLNFRVRGFDNVLFRELSGNEHVQPAQTPDPTISIRIVNKDDDAEVRTYSRLSMTGFSPPGFVPPETDFDLWSRVVKHPRTVSFIASIRDDSGAHDAGAGALEVHDEIACLFGLSTLQPYRKRGIQQSLIAARLNLAASRGVRVATIGSRPGAGTERNVRRMGFQTAYTKVFLTRAGPGLVPARG
jgi:GNAT superfamily N-acetyltransferase